MSKVGDWISWKSNNSPKSCEYLVLNNEDSFTYLALPYTRTSTPLPTRKHPGKITNYSINLGYEKWADKLKQPPTKLRVKGVKYPPEDIISGHLIPHKEAPAKRETPPIVLENLDIDKRLMPSLSEEINTEKNSKLSMSEKIKFMFKVDGKSFIKKTCQWFKSSDDDLCINGYPKCKCKLSASIVENYNLHHTVRNK